MARYYMKLSNEGSSLEELEKLTLGSLRRAVIDGDINNGSFMAGQISGLIKEIKPVKVIIEDLFLGIQEYKDNLQVL